MDFTAMFPCAVMFCTNLFLLCTAVTLCRKLLINLLKVELVQSLEDQGTLTRDKFHKMFVEQITLCATKLRTK